MVYGEARGEAGLGVWRYFETKHERLRIIL